MQKQRKNQVFNTYIFDGRVIEMKTVIDPTENLVSSNNVSTVHHSNVRPCKTFLISSYSLSITPQNPHPESQSDLPSPRFLTVSTPALSSSFAVTDSSLPRPPRSSNVSVKRAAERGERSPPVSQETFLHSPNQYTFLRFLAIFLFF
ncbi:hypothetical protein YC2023_086552 [Brassica napus]